MPPHAASAMSPTPSSRQPPAPITDAIARRIAEYWLDKPDAADSAKGIRDWWLAEASAALVSDYQVRQALQELADLGIAVQDNDHGGSSPHYRLALTREELLSCLAQSGGAPASRH